MNPTELITILSTVLPKNFYEKYKKEEFLEQHMWQNIYKHNMIEA